MVSLDRDGRATVLDGTPVFPSSLYAVSGLYFYHGEVVDIIRHTPPSAGGEIEINDFNRHYLTAGRLKVRPLGRCYVWLDTGTHESMPEVSQEEVAWRMKWISDDELEALATPLPSFGYDCGTTYLRELLPAHVEH